VTLGIPLGIGAATPAHAVGTAPRDAGTTALAAPDPMPITAGSGLGPRQGITDGPCTVYGWVSTPTGRPAANVPVRWSYIPPGTDVVAYGNSTTTDAAGYYSLSGVRATQFGSIYSYWDDDTFARQGFVWTSGSYRVDVEPGRVAFANTNATGLANSMEISAYSRLAGQGTRGTSITRPQGDTGEAVVLPTSIGYAIADYRDEYGDIIGAREWMRPLDPISVNPGALSAGQLTFDESAAHWAWVTAPYWLSGPPGSKVKLRLTNWKAPMTARISGVPEYPATARLRQLKTFTGTSSMTRTVTVTIPRSARPGYCYCLMTERTDIIQANDGVSLLELSSAVQLCTLKASRTSIRRGAAIRLSGVVPTEGHWGTTRGKKKRVVIYQRTKKPSGQPTTWDPRSKGWKKVATVTANGLGAYTSAKLRPRRTTWYIVRYPGDSDYYGGYTATVRVRVR
jgi:hypothetical protein